MGRRRDARRYARQTKRIERAWALRIAAMFVAVVVAGFTDDLWANWFDAMIDALGGGSTAAAFVGWLAAHAVVIYVLALLAVRRPTVDVFKRTWPLGVLLLIPFFTLQPSRTERSASIEDDYWYLGSFFDTYHAVLATIAVAGALGLLCVWQATRGDTDDIERTNRWLVTGVRVATATLAAGTAGTLVWALVGF